VLTVTGVTGVNVAKDRSFENVVLVAKVNKNYLSHSGL